MNHNQANELRRPLPASAVGFRLDAKKPSGGKYRCVVYIDARIAAERLTAVDPNWSEATVEVPGGAMRCELTVGGATRCDYGEGRDIKSRASDALKRAAVKFGVGAYLYALPPFRVSADGVWTKGNGDAGGLTKKGVIELRKQYEKWVKHPEFQKFGAVVDYADIDKAGERHADDEPTESDTQPVQRVEAPEKATQRAQKLEGLGGV